jgi:large repetitive protein
LALLTASGPAAQAHSGHDDPLTWRIADATVTEGGSAAFTVTLNRRSGSDQCVRFATAGGTATAGEDYTSRSGTLTIREGELSGTIVVATAQDALDEPDETFDVKLSSPSKGNLVDAVGRGTIADDDAPPVSFASVADVVETEGDGGSSQATFTVTLTPAPLAATTVDFATADVSAAAPEDYTAVAGQLLFAPGEGTRTVAVAIRADRLDEPDERFDVVLSGAAVSDPVGRGTIRDDDESPVADDQQLSTAEDTAVEIVLGASDGDGDELEYELAAAPLHGTLTELAGNTLSYSPAPDYNGLDSFTFRARDGSNVSNPATVSLTVTPVADPPLLSLADSTPVPEGADQTFSVSLSAPSPTPVVLEVRTSDGSARVDQDYGRSSTVVTFTPGQTLRTLPPVKTFADGLDEENETFHVVLELVEGDVAVPDAQAVGTIIDDDDPPSLHVGSASVTEGSGGSTVVSFVVGLSAPSGKTVTVGFETADGAATQPADYASASGTLSFAPGEVSQTFRVDVRGDTDAEPVESFTVRLRDPVNATVAAANATGTIVDDDSLASSPPPPPLPPPPPPTPPSTAPLTRSPTGVARQAGVVCTKLGTPGRDVILGSPRRDVICGLGGADTLVGMGGNDILVGGAGDDTLLGGGGRDRLLGGAGRDRLIGGSGNDRVFGGAGNDVLDGGLGGDHVDGGRDNDLLLGRGGRDTLLGAQGRDRLRGGAGIDRLDGGPGADALDGGLGRDRCLSGVGSTSCP